MFSSSFRSPDLHQILDQSTPILSWPSFEAAVARNLHMLHGIHVPVSLFAIGPRGLTQGSPALVIGDALYGLGTSGRLPDGRVGFFYLGPHGSQVDGGDEGGLTAFLRRRIGTRLENRGWSAVARDLKLSVGQGWTDETKRASELVAQLNGASVSRKSSTIFERRYSQE